MASPLLLDDLPWNANKWRAQLQQGAIYCLNDGTYDIYCYITAEKWFGLDKLTAQCVLNYLVGLQ